ncbi:MAG TPA: ATP-binding protein [Phycisphaerae bacterium]|nr:ATP-binding protein [Phycisphaerae bacterium]
MSELSPAPHSSNGPASSGGGGRGSKKAPRRMRREHERLARLDQLAEMGKLAAGLAHELKNPLSTLKLNLQLLEEDLAALPDTPEFAGRKRSMARIATLKKEADRLRHTLDDFLRFAGRIELRTTPVPLNRVVEELIDFIHPQAQAQRVRVLTALAAENPICPLDENLFKQAVLNLLLNAIQAMSVDRPTGDGEPASRGGGGGDGGGELLVRTLVSKGKEGDQAILYISDTGVGISREHLPHIFDAYFTTKKGGTGLGLPTTRRIIEEHHGLISVESEAGKGTSFRVELPLVGMTAARVAGGGGDAAGAR